MFSFRVTKATKSGGERVGFAKDGTRAEEKARVTFLYHPGTASSLLNLSIKIASVTPTEKNFLVVGSCQADIVINLVIAFPLFFYC